MSPFEQAELALQILQQLADAQAAVDGAGQPLQPLPLAHRLVASPQCLPHITQVGIYKGFKALIFSCELGADAWHGCNPKGCRKPEFSEPKPPCTLLRNPGLAGFRGMQRLR